MEGWEQGGRGKGEGEDEWGGGGGQRGKNQEYWFSRGQFVKSIGGSPTATPTMTSSITTSIVKKERNATVNISRG